MSQFLCLEAFETEHQNVGGANQLQLNQAISGENDFYQNKKSFSNQWLRTQAHIETVAKATQK